MAVEGVAVTHTDVQFLRPERKRLCAFLLVSGFMRNSDCRNADVDALLMPT